MKRNSKWLFILIFSLSLIRCGVKGDPVAPDTPAQIGRGRPTFKRAFEDIKVEAASPAPPAAAQKSLKLKRNDDGEDEESDDNENEN